MTATGRAHIILGSLCLLLFVLVGYETFAPIADIDVPVVYLRASSSGGSEQPPFSMPPALHFSSIDARQPFDPGRRTVAGPPAAVAAGAASSLASFTLIGIIIDRQTRMALIKAPGAPLVGSYSVGTSLQGWQIVQIEADRVVLRSSGVADQELRLTGKSQPPPAQTSDGL